MLFWVILLKQLNEQKAQGLWHSAWTEDPEHKNILKKF